MRLNIKFAIFPFL